MKEYESIYVAKSALTRTIKSYKKGGWRLKEKIASDEDKKVFLIFERTAK